ncbi:TolC family protein [Desulfomarina profundi]|uniref:TolC family protein n=1 Tax=Desulfomarina profundi TaxID=2772557 RepID=UPI001E38092F|nr:TolC family protein [Desulfomarina profundi]
MFSTVLFTPVSSGADCLALDLAAAMEMARRQSPAISENRIAITEARKEIKEIFGLFHSPQFELISYGGMVSDARGDITDTPDSNEDYGHMGPFFKADITAVQPIYSFGKYDNAMGAGKNNVAMKKAVFRESVNILGFEVAKAFLGVAAGSEGERIGRELVQHYRELLDRLEKMVEEQDGDIDAGHLLEAKTMLFEVEKQASRPEVDREKAMLYLRGLLGRDQDFAVEVIPVEEPGLDLNSNFFPLFLDFSRHHSPLLQSYDFGLESLKQKAALEKKMKYPDLFVAMGAGYGIAPNRDKQTNAFINDDYNYKKLGGVLGLKWDFNYHINSSKEEKALLEYRKIAAKKKVAMLKLEGGLRKAYTEARNNKKLLLAVEKSIKSARTWLRLENENFDMGIGDVKRLVKAYQAYYKLKGSEIETRFHYLLSLAELAKGAGDMDLFLLWIQNGKVAIPLNEKNEKYEQDEK